MKRQKRIKEENFFRVSCRVDGKGPEIALEIPNRLYDNFELCLKSSAGMSVLSHLYDDLAKLTEIQRATYQMLVYDYADKIIDIADMGCMLRAMLKVFPKEWVKKR